MQKRRFGFKKLHTKLLVATLLPMLLALALVGGVCLSREATITREAARQGVMDESAIVSGKLDTLFTKYLQTIAQGNDSVVLRRYFSNLVDAQDWENTTGYTDALAKLDLVYQQNPGLQATWLVDADTNVIFQNTQQWWRGDATWKLSDRPYYSRLIQAQSPFITEPYVNSSLELPCVSVICPVRDQAGTLLGVLAADCDLNAFATALLGAEAEYTEKSLLFTAAGSAVSVQGDAALRPISEMGYSENLSAAVLAGEEGTLTFTQGGQEYIGFLHRVDSVGFLVLSMLPTAQVQASTHQLVQQLFLIFLGAALLLSLLLWLLCRMITRPVRSLTRAACALAAGDLRDIPPLRSRDEIGQLSEAMCRTTRELCAMINTTREAVQRIDASAQQMNAGARQLADQTGKQMELAERFSAGMQQSLENVNHNVDCVLDTARLARASTNEISTSCNQMRLMQRTMRHVSFATQTIQSIARRSEDMSFQTHILSILANVETATETADVAGFAVIAKEVKLLAQDNAQAALDTKNNVGDITAAVNRSVQLTGETAALLSGCTRRVVGVSQRMVDLE